MIVPAANTTLKHLILLLSVVASPLMFVSSTSYGHAGNIDLNGGHYDGAFYHCHLGQCERPDTLNRRPTLDSSRNNRDRDKFYNTDDWNFELDADNDCQSTRQEMLILTSRDNVKYTNPRNCVVRTGDWLDEYTGTVFKVAVKMDIDHIIPLMYAHRLGGDRWSPQKKLAFANDPMNIMLVDKREIRRKRERGPSRYLPRKEFQCSYVSLWDAIADKYNLRIENRDKGRISKILRECEEN